MFKNLFWFAHFATANITAGKETLYRFNKFIAIFSAELNIVLSNRIFIHRGVHCGTNQFGAFCCKESCSKHIISNPVNCLCNHICSSRSNDKDICCFCKGYMFNLEFKITVKSIHQTFIFCQGFKGYGIDKIQCIFSHNYMNICMIFYQKTYERSGFISGDTACYTKNYGFSFKHEFKLLFLTVLVKAIVITIKPLKLYNKTCFQLNCIHISKIKKSSPAQFF